MPLTHDSSVQSVQDMILQLSNTVIKLTARNKGTNQT